MSSITRAAVVVTTSLSLSTVATATTYNWNVSGSGNWSTAGNNNWGTGTGGAFPNAADDVANFGSVLTSNATISLPAGTTTVGAINLTDLENDVKIQSNTLGLSNTGGNATINVQAGRTLEISSTIDATGEVMEKTGSGWLKLSSGSVSTYASILVSNGVLETTGEKQVGNYLNPLAVASGATFQFTNGNGKTLGGSMPLTLAGGGSGGIGAFRTTGNDAGTNVNGTLTLGNANANADARIVTVANAVSSKWFTFGSSGNVGITGTGGLYLDYTAPASGAATDTGFYLKGGTTNNDFTGLLTANMGGRTLRLGKNSGNTAVPNDLLAVDALIIMDNDNQIADGSTVTLTGSSTYYLATTASLSTGKSEKIARLVLSDSSALAFKTGDANSRLVLGGGSPSGIGLHLTAGGSLIVNNTFDPTYNVNGTAASSARDLAIVSGAVLGGSGTVGSTNFGSVTVNGTVAPGNSAGTLNVGVDTTVSGTYAYEAGDLLNITGGLTLGGSSLLDLVGALNPLTTYTIAQWTTAVTPESYAFGSVDASLLATHDINYNANSITLTPVPEPALAGVFTAIAFGAMVRRRAR